jgi:hypothetical protein
VSKSERHNQNVVISMTANQHTPRRAPVAFQAVRRGARALKRIHGEQALMWQGFWRASRFPQDHQ